MIDFIKMGGYGGYVWSAYGLVLLGMSALWLSSFKKWHQYKKQQAALDEQTS